MKRCFWGTGLLFDFSGFEAHIRQGLLIFITPPDHIAPIEFSCLRAMDMNEQFAIARGMQQKTREMQDVGDTLRQWEYNMQKDEKLRLAQNKIEDQNNSTQLIEVSLQCLTLHYKHFIPSYFTRQIKIIMHTIFFIPVQQNDEHFQ